MRTNCALLVSAVILGASWFSCSGGESGAGDSGAGTGQGGSSSGTADGGSTSVTSDGGGGLVDAAGHMDDASAGEGSPGGEGAAGEGGLLKDSGGGAVGEGGLMNDGGAGIGSSEAGAAGPVPGTTSIFDGKTLNGWEQSGTLWSVVNGVIDGKGTTGGQLLMTQADYGDFRVVVSSHMVAVGGSGHLGICFWGGRTPVGGYNNCKLIIPPGGYTWDYSLGGGLRGVTNIARPVVNPTWNTTEILCFMARGFCRVGINGTPVLTYQEPNLASIKPGPIGLQIHNGTNEEVQYKDVFVDPAPTVDKLLR
jgi:hypothetical protein